MIRALLEPLSSPLGGGVDAPHNLEIRDICFIPCDRHSSAERDTGGSLASLQTVPPAAVSSFGIEVVCLYSF
jgi:hypothetical protein